MTLSDIASVSGKGGLFKIGTHQVGVILESLDAAKTRLVASSNQHFDFKVKSIYTNTKEGSTPLLDVLKKIKATYGNDTGGIVNRIAMN